MASLKWTDEIVIHMCEVLGGQQALVDEIGAMSASFATLGYSPIIFMAWYRIDLHQEVKWDNFILNGHHITKKQFAYLRAHNINPNGIDCAQASLILDFLHDNGGTTRRVMATKWYKELVDLMPKSRIPSYRDTTVYDIKYVERPAVAVASHD